MEELAARKAELDARVTEVEELNDRMTELTGQVIGLLEAR